MRKKIADIIEWPEAQEDTSNQNESNQDLLFNPIAIIAYSTGNPYVTKT